MNIILFTVLLLPILDAYAEDPETPPSVKQCAARKYDAGIACVCNSTHCDNFQPQLPPDDSVLLVESNKDGKRFASRIVKFRANGKLRFVEDDIQTIEINTSKTYQKIIGFGGAFTDSASINIRSLSSDLTERLIKDYYGKDGIGYTMGRVPIGGCDFSTRPYTYDDNENDFDLKKFSLVDEDLKYKIPLLSVANRFLGKEFWAFASPWSAPAWMKTNSKLNESGTLKGPVGGKYYEIWANYFVRFLKEYEKHGIRFWGITVQNEPLTGFDPTYRFNTMGFTGEMERDFVKKNLGPTLRKAGYNNTDLKIMIYDHNFDHLLNFSTTVLSDKSAADYVAGVAVHWYANNLNLYSDLDVLSKRFPEKFILATEACYDLGRVAPALIVSLGNWTRAEGYAMDIIKDLNHGATGWVDWNLALSEEGGPNWVENFVDCPIIVNKTANEYYKNPMFYALGHFSKFLTRNSVRVYSTVTKSSLLQHVSFLTSHNEIVVVVLNPTDRSYGLKLRDNYNRVINLNAAPHSIISLLWKVR